MSSRSAKFVSAMCAGFLAGIPLATTSHGAAGPADNCLAAPKGALPQGGHWYYRVDRVSKRHCWYVGDAKEKLSRATPQDPSAVSPPKDPQRSIADAHAELPLPQTRTEPDIAGTGRQQTPLQAANVETRQRANPLEPNSQGSLVASRWPETGADRSAGAAPAAPDPKAKPPSSSSATPAPAPALAAVTPAAADASSGKPSGSIRMLLIVVVGALSLAGLIGGAIYRLGGIRWNGRRETFPGRRAIWDLAATGRLSPAASAADDSHGRIAHMIARLSRSGTT